jgi:predicted RNA binding protein YcfA (HicA-like mRNA interferase family)
MRPQKLFQKITAGAFQNVKFSDFQRLVELFGFNLVRVSGSHHIYSHPRIPELMNIQNVTGKAKPYQIRQFLRIVERYNLQSEVDK